MEIELAINLIGLVISILIGRFAYVGYTVVASPNLLRLTLAFVSISVGFVLLAASLFDPANRMIATSGLAAQAVGYFFIAMSHGLKSSFDFAPRPSGTFLIIPLAVAPLVIPGNSIEHIIRSISFILLVYVSIETMASYMQAMRSSTLMIGSGIGALAVAELVAWYDFIYPGSFFFAALIIKVAGFGLMFIPFSKFGLKGLGRMNQLGG